MLQKEQEMFNAKTRKRTAFQDDMCKVSDMRVGYVLLGEVHSGDMNL